MTAIEPVRPAAASDRRAELAAFLRARRSRITPAEVGLPPGIRRRTPGLRREELAQLAGVGVTWYTWLEQGRRIHVSAQVLNAVARTLRLDEAESAHLFQLAEAPVPPAPQPDTGLPDHVRDVLAALQPLPAVLLNSRYDVLAKNDGYEALFRHWHPAPCHHHNILSCCLLEPNARTYYRNLDEQLPRLVATLRASFAQHLGEPAWTDFIQALSAASPEFVALWARHDVARPGVTIKSFWHPTAGELTLRSTSMAVADLAETRIVVYTPADETTRARLPLVTG